MDTYTIESGLIVNQSKPGRCAGYLFTFNAHGTFDPSGLIKVNGRDLTEAEVNAHNALLGKAESDAYVKAGRGIFYLSKDKDGSWTVSTWAGPFKVKASHVKTWRAAAFGRLIKAHTAYFTGPDGKPWYGINKGDSQILRARQLKKGA